MMPALCRWLGNIRISRAESHSTRFVSLLLFVSVLLGAWAGAPLPAAQAQSIYLPAEINKSFTPITIVSGGVSRLSVTIFNPNAFVLTNAGWMDNLPAGIFLANPVNPVSTCGGTVNATAGGVTLSLAGGVVPAQAGPNPGACTVSVDVSSVTPGNLINVIPANGLTSTGSGGVTVTNTTPASATLQVGSLQPPSLNKNFAPNTMWAGDVSVLTINLINNDLANDLTDAGLTDNLPSGLVLADPVGATLTNCGAGALAATPGAATVTLTGATVAKNTTCRIQVKVTSTTQGTYTNTIPAGAIQTRQGVTNAAAASAAVNVQSIGLSKDFTAALIPAGGATPLTITLRNPTATAYTGVHVADTLPAPFLIAASPAPVNNCGGTLTAVPGTALIELNGGAIPASANPPAVASCTLVVTVTAPLDTRTTSPRTNTIPAGAMTTDQGITNPTPASDTLGVQETLTVGKAFIPAIISPGVATTVILTLRNFTGEPFTGVNLTDSLPAGLTVVGTPETPQCGGVISSTATSVTLTGGTIPASLNPPSASGSCNIEFQVTGAAGGIYTNTIPVGAVTTAQGASNASSAGNSVTVSNAPLPANSSKSFSPAVINAGANTRLRIEVEAPVDIALTNLSLTDVLPAGVTVSNSIAPTATNCGVPPAVLSAPTGASTISLTQGVVPAGRTCQINVYVTSSTPGRVTNSISAQNITYNEDRPLDTLPSADLTVTSLEASKAFYPPAVNPMGQSRLTITLTNHAPERLVDVSLTDSLATMGGTPPTSGVFIADPPNAATTCGGTITADAGAQTISLANGTVPAQVGDVAGVCTISVDVQGRGSATTRTNTLPVANVSGAIEGTDTVIHPIAAATADLTLGNLRIVVNKAFNPLIVHGGSASVMRIELRNPDPADQTGIGFTDNMPPGMIIANPPNFDPGTCGGALSGAVGASTVTFSGGALAAGTACTLTLNVTMQVNGNLTNTIPAGAVTTQNGVSNPEAAAATLTNLPGASVSKYFASDSIAAGPGNYTLLTITIRNTSSFALTGLGLVDNLPGTLPAGLVVAGAPAPAPLNDCGGALTAAAGTQRIQLSGGVLAGSSACSLVVPVNGMLPGTFVNTIDAGSLTNNENTTNTEPTSDTLTLTGAPALDVTKRLTYTGPLTVGAVLTYDIVATNTGNIELTNVTITDPGVGVTLGACTPAQPATLAPGAALTCSASHTLTQADIEAGSYTNTATGDSDQTPEDSDSETVTIPPAPALDVTKTQTATGPFELGDTLAYDIVATNTGNLTLTGVTLTDTGVAVTLGACTPAQPATLAPGAALTCSASHVVSQADVEAGSYTNTAIGDSDQTPEDSDSETVRIQQDAALQLEKTGVLNLGSDGVATAGDTITYTFAVTNTGKVTLTQVMVSDPRIHISGGPIASLAPGAVDTTTFTGSYTLTQADLDAGSFTNIATAEGTAPGGVVSDSDDDVQTFNLEPAIGIAKRVVGSPVSAGAGAWDVTFALVVRNYGNVTLGEVKVKDDLKATFPLPATFTVRSVTSSELTVNPKYNGATDQELLAGSDTLQAGEEGKLTLVVRVIPASAGPYKNTAVASGITPKNDRVTDRSQDGVSPDPDQDGDPTNNEAPTPLSFDGNLFAPPFGIKTATEAGSSILRWTVTWINNTNHVAILTEAYDEVPSGTSFVNNGVASGYALPAGAPAGSVAGGVACTDTSLATSTQYCYYEGPTGAFPRGRVVWRGTLGPDFGAKEAAGAANEIQISFNLRLDEGVTKVTNVAVTNTDLNGDGDVEDPGEQRVATARETWERPVSAVQELPATGFAPHVITALPAQPADRRYSNESLTLEIPAIGAQMTIVGVPQAGKGWDVTWLGSQAGWLNGTAYPGWKGNSVLTGHVWDALNQPGPFARVKALKYGDEVRLHTGGQVYVYQVRENRAVLPNQAQSALRHEERAWVTLLTCEDYNPQTDTYANRRMVRAVLVKVIPEK